MIYSGTVDKTLTYAQWYCVLYTVPLKHNESKLITVSLNYPVPALQCDMYPPPHMTCILLLI